MAKLTSQWTGNSNMTMDNGTEFAESTPPVKVQRALLLANAQARSVSDQLPEAIAWLESAGWELNVQTPRDASDLGDLVRKHRDSVDVVIVGGGDGTLNAVADAIVETGLPLGVLPLGTANDLARTVGLPLEIEAACRVITEGYRRAIDLGAVNGKHFFNAASLGISVQISRQLDKEAKKRWGVLAYLFTTARVVWQMRPFRAEISDGENHWRVRTVQITVGNGHFFGGGMTVEEDATIDDQQLDLSSIEVGKWWEMPLLFWSLRKGRLAHLSKVRTLHGKYFEIKTRRSYWINTDGELTVRTPATFRVVPRALTILVPRLPQAVASAGVGEDVQSEPMQLQEDESGLPQDYPGSPRV